MHLKGKSRSVTAILPSSDEYPASPDDSALERYKHLPHAQMSRLDPQLLHDRQKHPKFNTHHQKPQVSSMHCSIVLDMYMQGWSGIVRLTVMLLIEDIIIPR